MKRSTGSFIGGYRSKVFRFQVPSRQVVGEEVSAFFGFGTDQIEWRIQKTFVGSDADEPRFADEADFWHGNGMDAILEPIRLAAPAELGKNNDWLFNFCRLNPELRIERRADGEVLIMSPESASIGSGSLRLGRLFDEWAEKDGTGRVFGSSAGFILPDGAMRSPDLAWVSNGRLADVAKKHWKKFLPVCPDFVLELRSPSDRMRALKEKMDEYIANGARLGWLIDPDAKEVHIYEAGQSPKVLKNPTTVSGEPVLRKFNLEMRRVWAAMEP